LAVDSLRRAKGVLGARTQTEAVERARSRGVFQAEALKGFRALCERDEADDAVGHRRATGSR